LTVFTEMYISAAISTVLSISERCRSASRSRSVSGSMISAAASPARAAWAGIMAGVQLARPGSSSSP